MKGEQTMKKVNLNDYAAICRAARRGNLIAKMRVKNVEVDNDNELVKLVAESLKKSSDFFATLCCTDPNVGTTALGQWAEGVWKSKERWQELEEVRNGKFLIMGSWIFEKNSFEKEDLLEKQKEHFIRSLAKLMKDIKEEAEYLGVNVRQGMTLDSLNFSI